MASLALIRQLSQEEIRHQILHTWESAQHEWVIPIHLGPIDISLNKGVWFLFIGAAVTFLIMYLGARYLKDRPGMYQVIVEELYGFGRNHLGGQVAEEGRRRFPYTLSLFIFLLVLNIIGLFPNSYPVTSSSSFTLPLALLTFFLTQFEGVRRNGLVTYVRSLVPSGLPAKPIMVPFMAFIEIVQELSKPLTLGMRLYANILAGHLIIFVFLSFILYFGTFMAVISVPAAIVLFAFEIFVAGFPCFIFVLISTGFIELVMFWGEE